MKRFLLLLSFLLIGIVQTFAYDFEVDGIYYNILSGTTNVEVTIKGNYSSSCSGSVTIPSSVDNGGTTYSVTSIGNYAFYYSGLTSVVIPSSVTSIGNHAFSNCSGLTSVVIPSSVTSISSYAFWACSGLTSVVIPSSVTSIGNDAFSGCSGLTSISVDAANTVYDSRNNCNAIIKKSNNQLIAGCKNTVIPSSVTSIGPYAFYSCSGLTSVVIPSSVTSIGDYAFRTCSGLTSVEIPSSVTSIGSYAFGDCSGLTSISVDAANTVYDSRNNCNAIIKKSNNQLVAGCKNTVIPSSVTSIGNDAFSNCSGLTSVDIPSSVTSIGFSAFSNCSGLTSVDIPSSVTSIGNLAFYNCSGLTSAEIPSSVTSIGDYAFRGCSGLTSVTMLCPPTPNIESVGFADTTTIYVTRANYDAYVALGLSNRIEILNEEEEYDDILYLDNQELQAGTDATLSLKLRNNVDITSLQFDLVLPECFTIPNGSNGKPNIEVSTSRTTTSKHKVYSNPQDDGSLRVICASLGNYAFSETDGEVLQIHIRVAADATAGVHDIIFKNIELTQPDNTQHEVEQVQYSVTVTERARQKGDVNNDGLINAVDVDLAGQILLQKLSYDSYADMDDNGTVTIGDVTEIIRVATEPKPEEHEYVDLGLPSGTLWATCNIGAATPEDYGDYFAWGESITKEQYKNFNYQDTEDDCESYIKYNYSNGKTQLDLEDDAAFCNWGSSWCLPTAAQFEELLDGDNTSLTWTLQNGVVGLLIESKRNANSLFFPAAGGKHHSEFLVGKDCYYATRNLDSSTGDPLYMYAYSSSASIIPLYRSAGRPVRAVRNLSMNHIRNTGPAAINLDYTFQNDTRIVTKMSVVSNNGNILLGERAWSGNDNNDLRFFSGRGIDLGIYFDLGSGRIKYNATQEFIEDVHEYEFGNYYLKCDGETLGSRMATKIVRSAPLYLFSDSRDQGVVYYIKIYEGETLVREYIPIEKDGEHCLYERLQQRYYMAESPQYLE